MQAVAAAAPILGSLVVMGNNLMKSQFISERTKTFPPPSCKQKSQLLAHTTKGEGFLLSLSFKAKSPTPLFSANTTSHYLLLLIQAGQETRA